MNNQEENREEGHFSTKHFFSQKVHRKDEQNAEEGRDASSRQLKITYPSGRQGDEEGVEGLLPAVVERLSERPRGKHFSHGDILERPIHRDNMHLEKEINA